MSAMRGRRVLRALHERDQEEVQEKEVRRCCVDFIEQGRNGGGEGEAGGTPAPLEESSEAGEETREAARRWLGADGRL